MAGGPFPSVVEAKDYYVSNKAEAGKGTKENPFGLPDLSSADQKDPKRDVGKACAALQPGDTLWFKGGEYLLESKNEGGHSSVETTMIYTHVLNSGGRGVRSPLDQLSRSAYPAPVRLPGTVSLFGTTRARCCRPK